MSGVELTNDGLIPIVPELHHLAKTHALKTLDQVINAWEFFLIGPVDPSTLLHRPIDEFTPKELVLHRRMEVGIKSILGRFPKWMVWTPSSSYSCSSSLKSTSNSSNGEASRLDLSARPLPCLRGCSSSYRSSMAQSSSLRTPGEVPLLDLLTCGVFLFLGFLGLEAPQERRRLEPDL